VGLAGVVVAEFLPPGGLQSVVAGVGFVGLGLASLILLAARWTGWAEPRPALRSRPFVDSEPASRVTAWRWTLLGLGVAGVLVTQSWFQAGTVIAGGDIAPPIGTAWTGRLFAMFTWSGSNLGGPAAKVGQLLPWGAVDWLTHLAGGSGALAQRMWLSFLVASVLVAAGALARALMLSPVAGVVVGIFYLFNPMTVTWVGVNSVYLVAMGLLAALPALAISYGRGNLHLWQLNLAFIGAAPFVGYAYQNPPLVGMLAVVVLVTPLLVLLRFGSNVAARLMRGSLISGPLLIAASCYWIIPAKVAVSELATGNLSPLSAWAFTEMRYSLANGFWLNSFWGWHFTAYYPYAPDFGRFPLDLVPALLPVLAFLVLALRRLTGDDRARSMTRLTGGLALLVLFVIFLATGTQEPGAVLFDTLYRLPYGWLLQEPDRFLMSAALGYALLVGLLIERLRAALAENRTSSFASAWTLLRGLASRSVPVGATIAVAAAAGFPLWTGALIPGPRQGFPSSHVRVPRYWTATANYLNSSSAPQGALLVLPPDDFYQMPYTWYYGNDSFIADLMRRNVVVPAGQGAESVSSELLDAVRLEASAIAERNWKEAAQILRAIGTPLVLVRSDIEADFPGRNIIPARILTQGLAKDPDMRLIYQAGKLAVYELRPTFGQTLSSYATVSVTAPDLRLFSLLRPGTALVTSAPQRGHIAIVQLPNVTDWTLGSGSLYIRRSLLAGWKYTARFVVPRPRAASRPAVEMRRQADGALVMRISMPLGPSIITDGSFSRGLWGPVGNCEASQPIQTGREPSGAVISRAGPLQTSALQLTASTGSACESTPLSWKRGPILLRLWVRSISGAAPRICLWEDPVERCAATSALPAGHGWTRYSVIADPSPGTTRVSLYLYADALGGSRTSTEEYAGIVAYSLPAMPNVVIFGKPMTKATPSRLLQALTGYSTAWSAPAVSHHVIVDGMRNGWILGATTTRRTSPHYIPATEELLDEILLAVLMIVLALGLWRRWHQRLAGSRANEVAK
jgi:arabinofuranan 3-O-arabinosyltransferase